MKALLKEIWIHNRKAFVKLLCMECLMALLGGVGIVMVLPFVQLLEIGQESSFAALLPECIMAWPHAAKMTILVLLYVGVIVLKALLGRYQSLAECAFQEENERRLRNQLHDALMNADWEQLRTAQTAKVMNMLIVQCSQVSSALSVIVSMFFMAVSTAVQLAIALYINIPLTIVICVLGLAMIRLFRPLRELSHEFGDKQLKVAQAFHEEMGNQMGSIREIHAYGVEKEHAQRFDMINSEYRNMRLAHIRRTTTPDVIYSISAAVAIAAVYLVATLVFDIALDRLVVLVLVFSRLWPLFSRWQYELQYVQSCLPAYESICEMIVFMQKKGVESAQQQEESFEGWENIRLCDVSFAYADAMDPVLQRISMTLPRGSVTALVGRNGTGKSTLANLLLGFLYAQEGQILIGDTPLTKENIRAWRRQVGYIPQEPLILNASVRENLQRFHPAATEDEMIAALQNALAWDFVSRLPEGLDTKLGERGVRLSGGERQRIVLARVLLGHPQLIILDEATSALDGESETAFREMIQNLYGDRTVLVIAHHLTTVKMASQVITLEDGRIVQQGTYCEMMDDPDSYLSRMVSIS